MACGCNQHRYHWCTIPSLSHRQAVELSYSESASPHASRMAIFNRRDPNGIPLSWSSHCGAHQTSFAAHIPASITFPYDNFPPPIQNTIALPKCLERLICTSQSACCGFKTPVCMSATAKASTHFGTQPQLTRFKVLTKALQFDHSGSECSPSVSIHEGRAEASLNSRCHSQATWGNLVTSLNLATSHLTVGCAS